MAATKEKPESHHGISGVATFFIVLIILIIIGIVAWIAFTQLRARRLGLPPPPLSSYIPFKKSSAPRNYPAPAPGGIVGWFNDKFQALKNRRSRTAGGAYEEPLADTRGRHTTRGFGPLDPDEAWDARVGHEADGYGPGGYYEEQELGLHSTHNVDTSYGGGGYGGPATKKAALPGYGDGEVTRGRSRSREPPTMVGGSQRGLDERYDAETARGSRHDPFDDAAEPSNMSLRGVSPRPVEGSSGGGHRSQLSVSSNQEEKRSIFHEDM
ncbi:MAG: hypothetical protein M1824_003924 [Vezdaea acicularis]|nr:MAG: hypothetical protein M1824_003924 [Vezdaea acicularis]